MNQRPSGICRRARISVAVALAFFVSTGCASFAKHKLPEASVVAVAEPVESTFDLTWTMHVGAKTRPEPALQRILETEFSEIMTETGALTLRRGMQGDVHVSVQMRNHGSRGAAVTAGLISGLTFGAIPTWATDHYELKARVTTKSGDTVNYLLEDSMRTVIWLPLILLTPFLSPEDVSRNVRANMYRTLVANMQGDGLISAAAISSP